MYVVGEGYAILSSRRLVVDMIMVMNLSNGEGKRCKETWTY